jgi:hypothetical protein
MNLIRMTGPEAAVAGLSDIADLVIIESSGQTLETGDVQLSGYATDRAITEIESRGAVVEVIMNNAELTEHYDELYAKIDSDDLVA